MADDAPPQRRPAELGETGVGEHAGGADVEFIDDGLLRRHRIALESAGATLLGEVDRGAGQCRRDAPLAEAGARDEAGHGPDAAVGLVLISIVPRDAVVAE